MTNLGGIYSRRLPHASIQQRVILLGLKSGPLSSANLRLPQAAVTNAFGARYSQEWQMLADPILHFACEGSKQSSRRLRRQRNDMKTLYGKWYGI